MEEGSPNCMGSEVDQKCYVILMKMLGLPMTWKLEADVEA